ncbi:MAG: EthD domain-containing protein [Pseudomonadota bacterium]|nr:EthD domain-containing protein [Pseudomonadota bacterium]
MLKACTLVKRRSGMEVETFQKYWLGKHADIVRKLPLIKRYVQSHPLLGGYRKGKLIYDGLAEIWVDNTDALRSMAKSDAYRAVTEDEANFIDASNTSLLLTEEHVIKDGKTPKDGIKSIGLVTRKIGMNVHDFHSYWKDIHGPIANEISIVRRYVQSHTKLAGYNRQPSPSWDGIGITWFSSVDEMRTSVGTPEYEATLADGANFTETASQHLMLTKEHFIIE